jgi:peptidoglycan hydrolase-like protein with peptidoglycan-binding domain
LPAENLPQEISRAGSPARARSSAAPAKQVDPISQLLQGESEPRPSSAPAAVKPANGSKAVLAAQRALIKLGFVLKADGVPGAATRQAVERYEREHGLAVRGELTPEIVRKLTAEAGLH